MRSKHTGNLYYYQREVSRYDERKIPLKITVEIMSLLRCDGDRRRNCTVQDEMTVSELIKHLGYSSKEKRYLITIVNQKKARFSQKLQNGDHVFITMPIGGG